MQQNDLSESALQTYHHINQLINQQSKIICPGKYYILIKDGEQIWKCVRIPCKVIPIEFLQQLEQFAQILNNETQKLQLLQNTEIRNYIPQLLEIKQLSFSMKYITLGSLEDLLTKVQGYLSSHTVSWISFQLFQLIQSLHNQYNIVHFDIKSDNIMIEQSYELQYDQDDNTIQHVQLNFNQALMLILIKLYAGKEFDLIDLKNLKSKKQIDGQQYQQIMKLEQCNYSEFQQINEEDFELNCKEMFIHLFQNRSNHNTIPLLNGTTLCNAQPLIKIILQQYSTYNTINPYAFKITRKYRLILIDFGFSKSINGHQNLGFGTQLYMAPEIINLMENYEIQQMNNTDQRIEYQFRLNQMDLRKCDLFSYGMLLFNLRFYSNDKRPKYSNSQLQYYREVVNFIQNNIFDIQDQYSVLICQLIDQNPQLRPSHNYIYNVLQQIYQNINFEQVCMEFHSQLRYNQFPQ